MHILRLNWTELDRNSCSSPPARNCSAETLKAGSDETWIVEYPSWALTPSGLHWSSVLSKVEEVRGKKILAWEVAQVCRPQIWAVAQACNQNICIAVAVLGGQRRPQAGCCTLNSEMTRNRSSEVGMLRWNAKALKTGQFCNQDPETLLYFDELPDSD